MSTSVFWRRFVSALVAIFSGLLAGTIAFTLDLFLISGQERLPVVIIVSGITAIVVDSLVYKSAPPAPIGAQEEGGQEEARA